MCRQGLMHRSKRLRRHYRRVDTKRPRNFSAGACSQPSDRSSLGLTYRSMALSGALIPTTHRLLPEGTKRRSTPTEWRSFSPCAVRQCHSLKRTSRTRVGQGRPRLASPVFRWSKLKFMWTTPSSITVYERELNFGRNVNPKLI